jgi:predicted Zn-dependent protease
MNALEPPDSQHLEAAQGWLDLGNHVEANEELEQISVANRTHPNVLQVRWRVYAKAEKWDTCLEIATALTRLTPERRFGWLHLAMSLRKLNRTAEAKNVLLSVLDKFDRNSTFPYYLACYCAQMGQTTEAKGWFTLALANGTTDDERERIKHRAQDDPELAPIRSSLKDL